MMFNGCALILAVFFITVRTWTERRSLSILGYSLMALMAAVSAYRRIVFRPGEFLAQVNLDTFVVCTFTLGTALLAMDAVARHFAESGPHKGPGSRALAKRLLASLMIPTCLLLLSANVWAWTGDRSAELSMERAIEQSANAVNPGAAMHQGFLRTTEFADKLRELARNGTDEQRAYARATLRALKLTMEKP